MNIIEKNREIMHSRLSKREQLRQKHMEETHKQREEEFVKSEGLDYFCNVFSQKKQEINQLLEETSSKPINELPVHFNVIRKLLQEVQQYVTDSTLFLTEFKIRNCQEIISSLQNVLCDQEIKYIPKRKFGFKNKKLLLNDKIIGKDLDTKSKDMTDLCLNKCNDWNLSQCGFHLKENEILYLYAEQVNKKDITLSSIYKCTVIITGYPNTLHMSNIQDSTVICGPVTTSIFADKCINSKLVIACQQLRLHSSKNVDVYLHVTSRAILEDSTNIRFAPYNYIYAGIDSDFQCAALQRDVNNWSDVGDFNWLSNEPSPNWSIMEENARIKQWNVL
ncbi:tubulin-specific chaperone C-like [Ctenocephalides felis]|uniref:tubulin-specific chaperone C-like n=1 Tax=Ctenocephalides felis TaxID=7515 RepID=UPI000E6E53CA|nr:tubulin-specific chaperone C-like [Ctenocephalides felis]